MCIRDSAYAARIPVVFVMAVAIWKGAGTHYDLPPPGFPAMPPLRRWFWFFAPDSVDTPETVCGGIVESPPEPSSGTADASVPPDRVLLANWGRVFGTEWDATADDSRFAGDDLCMLIYWSPDDAQVSFLANDRSGLALWRAHASGAQPARKLAEGQPFYWDWTADSQQLLVHSGWLGAEARLGFIDTNGNAVGDDLATPGLFQAPGIAADGR